MEFDHVEGFYFQVPIFARPFCMKSDKPLAWNDLICLRNSSIPRSQNQLAHAALCLKERTQFE